MREFTRRRLMFITLAVSGIVLASVFMVYTASNSVTNFYLDDDTLGVSPSEFLPAECKNAGITSVNKLIVVTAGGSTTGSKANDLILGTSGDDTGGNQLKGGGGDDCLVGGDGNDSLKGGKGNDVLIGGAGDDDLDGGQDDDYMDGGENTDVCDIKHGADTYDNCETVNN